MWCRIERGLKRYSNAVLTGLDEEGYPCSIRCVPQLDMKKRVICVHIPDGMRIQPGPAGLLSHFFNENAWNVRGFLVRGRLKREKGNGFFYPEKYVGGLAMSNPFTLLGFLIRARKTAKHYLQARGLARPEIPWGAFKAIHEEERNKDNM